MLSKVILLSCTVAAVFASIHHQHEAGGVHHQHEAAGVHHQREAAGVHHQHEAAGVHHQHEAAGVHHQHEAAGVHHQHEAAGVHHQHEAAGVHHQHEAAGVHHQHEAAGVHHQHEAAGVHHQYEPSGVHHQHEAGGVHHQYEAAAQHHIEPLVAKSATIVKEAPIGLHEGARYGHGHGGHDSHEGHNCYQRYKFGYKILDKYGNKQAREEEADEYNNRKGYYSFIDHDGLHRKVEYVADKHGFRATVITNEPGTAKQHPADVNMLANPLKIAHLVKSQAIEHSAYGDDYAQGGLDPRGAPALVSAPVAAAPLAKEATAVIAPVAIAKQPAISAHIALPAPIGIVKAAPIAAHITAPIIKGPAYAHAGHVLALPQAAPISGSHTYASHQVVGHAHHYSPAVHAHVFAPVSNAHTPSGYIGSVGHRSHGLAHQASYAHPVSYPVPYRIRMAFVTGGYRRKY